MKDLKNGKVLLGLGIFMAVMLACTLLSKGIYASKLPQVTVEKPRRMAISHKVEAAGNVKQGREFAVNVPAGLRVKEVFVVPGDKVEEGQPLFLLDTDYMEEAISEKELERKKLELQIQTLEHNLELAGEIKDREMQRSGEDAADTVRHADRDLQRAEEDEAKARQKLQEHAEDAVGVTSEEERRRQEEEYYDWQYRLESARQRQREAAAEKESISRQAEKLREQLEQLEQAQAAQNDGGEPWPSAAGEPPAEPEGQKPQPEAAGGQPTASAGQESVQPETQAPEQSAASEGQENVQPGTQTPEQSAASEGQENVQPGTQTPEQSAASAGQESVQPEIQTPDQPGGADARETAPEGETVKEEPLEARFFALDGTVEELQNLREKLNMLEEKLQAAQAAAQAADEEVAALEEEGRIKPDFSLEDAQQEAWENEQENLLGQLQSAGRNLEDARESQEDAYTKAQRGMEDAMTQEMTDSALGLYRMEYQKLQEDIEKMKAYFKNGGEIRAEMTGTVMRLGVSTGESTPSGAAMVFADTSGPLQFEVILDKEQKKYVDRGAEGSLTLGNAISSINNKIPVTVDYLNELENMPGSYAAVMLLPEGQGSIGQSGTFSTNVQSDSFPCCIPLDALRVDENERYFVYVAEESETILGTELTAQKRMVEVLDFNDKYAAIEQGAVDEGTQLICFSTKEFAAGDVVRLKE